MANDDETSAKAKYLQNARAFEDSRRGFEAAAVQYREEATSLSEVSKKLLSAIDKITFIEKHGTGKHDIALRWVIGLAFVQSAVLFFFAVYDVWRCNGR